MLSQLTGRASYIATVAWEPNCIVPSFTRLYHTTRGIGPKILCSRIFQPLHPISKQHQYNCLLCQHSAVNSAVPCTELLSWTWEDISPKLAGFTRSPAGPPKKSDTTSIHSWAHTLRGGSPIQYQLPEVIWWGWRTTGIIFNKVPERPNPHQRTTFSESHTELLVLWVSWDLLLLQTSPQSYSYCISVRIGFWFLHVTIMMMILARHNHGE